MGLLHIAYASEAAVTFSDPALRELLERARKKNTSIGVTGVLLLIDKSFFQMVEGEAEAVQSLYGTISGDKRHKHPVKLIEEPIERRDFGEWSMGLTRATSKEMSALAGFSDFRTTNKMVDTLSEGMARRLLSAFQDGRWRAPVEK